MAFTFEETPDSRSETYDPPAYTLIYKAAGEHDDYIVSLHAQSATPITVFRPTGTLYRRNITMVPDGHAQYIVTVPYGQLDSSNVPTGSSTFSFDTSGATVKIKAAKEHVATYPTTNNHHKGAIGVKEDGDVEGADIVVPALKLTYGFSHAQGVVSETFARTIASATGRTNANAFRGFAQGELLFVGGSGSDGTEAAATVDYSFIAQANETSMSIGEISGIVKKGHHYAWVEFEDDTSGGEAIKPPKRVHVERVYDEIDFATYFGWS